MYLSILLLFTINVSIRAANADVELIMAASTISLFRILFIINISFLFVKLALYFL